MSEHYFPVTCTYQEAFAFHVHLFTCSRGSRDGSQPHYSLRFPPE